MKDKNEKTIWWHSTGPRLSFHKRDGYLRIQDLNPQLETKWALTRIQLLKIAWGMLRMALRRPPIDELSDRAKRGSLK